MFSKRIRLKLFLGGIVVTAAIAVVGAPLGNAARSHKAACQESPGHWVSVTDDLGVPTLELVGATVCTDAVTGQACTASQSTQPSPYPGWVQVTDDTGVPWLYPAGSGLTLSANCVQTNVTASLAAGSPAPASPQSSTMALPYPGWVVVTDDQGVPWLQPVSP
jgi:hypothetical protein